MLFTLIKNEMIKLFRRTKTYVVIGLFIALIGFIYFGLYMNEKNMIQYNKPEYKISQLENQLEWIDKDSKNIDSSNMTKEELENLKKAKEEEKKAIQAQIDSLKKQISEGTTDDQWKVELDAQIANIEANLKDNNIPERYKTQERDRLQELKYYKDNNIKPMNDWEINSYSFVTNLIMILGTLFVAIGVGIFNSDMVSGECTPATLKFLLIQPVSRAKILLAKFITSVISSVGLILSIEGISFFIVGLIKGFGYSSALVTSGARYTIDVSKGEGLIQIQGSSTMIPLWQFTLEAICLQVLFIFACCAFIFMLSVIFKSSMISMASSIAIMIVVTILLQSISYLKKFAHLIFISFGDTASLVQGRIALNYNNVNMTLNNGIIVMVVWIVVCYAISHFVFTKRDILI